MKRRNFLKSLGLLAVTPTLPIKATPANIEVFAKGWYIDYADKTINATPGAENLTVLELHRLLTALSDREIQPNEVIDISSPMPSIRYTDHFIELTDYKPALSSLSYLGEGTIKGPDYIYTSTEIIP